MSLTLTNNNQPLVPFWVQIHGLPLQNMTIKNAISIGKGLSQFLKVEDNNGETAAFRIYLKVLVSIDVNKPLNPGFNFNKSDGTQTWVSLKYERLDVYCTDCGKIGHHQSACLARPMEKHPKRYLISLKVNVFSNLPVSMNAANASVNHQESDNPMNSISNSPCFTSSIPIENQKKNMHQFQKSPVTTFPCTLVPTTNDCQHSNSSLTLPYQPFCSYCG
jgi:hypothetical protein